MTSKYSVFEKATVGCRGCRKLVEAKIISIINADEDPHLTEGLMQIFKKNLTRFLEFVTDESSACSTSSPPWP